MKNKRGLSFYIKANLFISKREETNDRKNVNRKENITF